MAIPSPRPGGDPASFGQQLTAARAAIVELTALVDEYKQVEAADLETMLVQRREIDRLRALLRGERDARDAKASALAITPAEIAARLRSLADPRHGLARGFPDAIADLNDAADALDRCWEGHDR